MTGNDSRDTPLDIESEFFLSSVRQMRELTSLPEKHFTLFYKAPLQRFLALSRFSEIASIQAHFNNLINALKLRRSVTLPIHSSAEHIHAQKDVWTYAIFIGALMYGSSRLIANKVVYRPARSTAHYFRWTPFDDSLANNIDAQVKPNPDISIYASLVFLPLVFDAGCLAWIFRDTKAFNTAIELAVSPDPNTEPGRIILTSSSSKPNSGALSSHLDDENLPPENEQLLFDNEQPEVDAETLSQHFRRWLSDALANRCNEKYFCMTPDGFATADPAVFQYYASVIQHRDWQRVRRNILSNVPHKKCPYQVHFKGTAKSAALLFSDPDSTQTALKND